MAVDPVPISNDSHDAPGTAPGAVDGNATESRANSFSQQSDNSQTAADFIRDQLQLEADAREALPYVSLFHLIGQQCLIVRVRVSRIAPNP